MAEQADLQKEVCLQYLVLNGVCGGRSHGICNRQVARILQPVNLACCRRPVRGCEET